MSNISTKNNTFSFPVVVHKITSLYKDIYILCKKLPKQDRFGIGKKIEDNCINCLALSIESALSTREVKKDIIPKIRIRIEILKTLIRILEELKIIDYKKYLFFQEQLQEISKMTYKWQISISPQKEQEAPKETS